MLVDVMEKPSLEAAVVSEEEWAALEALERDAQIFARLRGDTGDVLLFLLEEHSRRFVMVSRTVEDALGWTQSEIARHEFFELVHPDDRERTNREHERFAAGDRTVALGFRNRYRCRDGRYVWIEWGDSWRSALGAYTLIVARLLKGEP